MDESIRYREPESRADHVLEPKQRVPLYNLRKNAEKQLSVKLPGINNAWYTRKRVMNGQGIRLILT